MRRRLVWKIMGTFLLTLAIASGGPFYYLFVESSAWSGTAQLRAARLQTAAAIREFAGQDEFEKATAHWSERSRRELAHLPPAKALNRIPPPPVGVTAWYVPFVFHVIVGLLCSAALALYLSHPLVWLRDGFRRLSSGELDTRLAQQVGSRRDEIADLAQDFDVMAERLEQLIRARDRLLHDVSHELRSPLARISVAIGLARQSGSLSNQTLSRIERESERLNAIVGDLLSLSRSESNAAVEEIFFDVAELLRLVCDDARFEAQPRDVAVELSISPELTDPEHAPVVKGTPEPLRRAFENVIRNALRFAPSGTAVNVEARLVSETIVIEVRDNGSGVSPGMLSTMFEPFAKGSEDGAGAGLGLAIARRALASYEGSLQAENLRGGGLLMRLSLPVDRTSLDPT